MNYQSSLTSGRLLAKNAAWNLIGQYAPLIIAVFAIPILIRVIGVDRFAILTLAWLVIGYFGFFDLGLGRSLTIIVADSIGGAKKDNISTLIWTALSVLILLGMGTAVIVIGVAPWMVQSVLKVPNVLKTEALTSSRILAISIPVVTATSGLRGLLEANQRFGVLNAIRVPMGAFTFAGPLAVLPFSHSLIPIITTLVVGRFLAAAVHLIACFRTMPDLLGPFAFQFAKIKPVLRLGGWITISNIVNPLLIYMDRFIIGSLLSLAAVTYYTTPLEIVTKVSLIAAAVAGVVLPAFALSFAQDPRRTSLLLNRSVKFIFLMVFPLCLIIFTYAPEALTVWLGPDFAQHSATVLRWLAVGVFINCLAQVPFVLVQSVGRPDITAILVLVDLPIYLVIEWLLISKHGIEGAAIGWTLRATLDAVILFIAASRLVPAEEHFSLRLVVMVPLGFLILYLAIFPEGLATKAIFLVIAVMGFAAISWFLFLVPAEKMFARNSWNPMLATINPNQISTKK